MEQLPNVLPVVLLLLLQDADLEAEVAYITARQSTSAAGAGNNNDAAGASSSGEYACRHPTAAQFLDPLSAHLFSAAVW